MSSFVSATSGKSTYDISLMNVVLMKLIRSVGKQIVNVPSFIVRLDSQKHIDFALTSPFGGGRPGRVRRKKAKAAESKEDGDEGGEEEEE